MNNESTMDVETIHQVSAEVIYQQDKALVDVQVSTAKAFPRNVKRSTENALAIATMDIEVAEICTYAVPRGGKTITGPSVHLAKIIAQQWKNLRMDAKVVAIDDKHVTSEAVCFDLENNIAFKAQVKRSIVGKKGDRFNEDMITVTGNAANSIAIRNAIFSVIPKAVVDKCYKAVKAMIAGEMSDQTKFLAKRKLVFEGLRDSFNLTEKEILSSIGRQALDHVTPEDLVTLIGIGNAIKDGDATIDQSFKKEPAAVSLEDLRKLYDEKLPLLSPAEVESGKRIIETEEKGSYKKLFTLLTNKK